MKVGDLVRVKLPSIREYIGVVIPGCLKKEKESTLVEGPVT